MPYRYHEEGRNARRRSGSGAWPVLWMTVLAAAGCGDLLTVNDPDIVRPEDLDTPAGLLARRAGAFGDFAKAYGGDATASDAREGQVLATGLFTDEFKKTGTDPDRIAMDARRMQNTNSMLTTFYATLHRARQAAESTARAYTNAGEAEDANAVIAEMMSLAGFTYTFFGEDFCSSVPFSTLTETNEIEYGQPLTTEQMFERSVERFDEAISRAQAAGRADLEHLARVGKARALLNLARFSDAASAVSGVPTSFRYEIKYSTNTPRQQNAVYYANNLLERWSVVNREGLVGIEYLDAFTSGDPRTPFEVAPDSVGFDESVGVQYNQLVYPDLAAPIPLATGIEARLVEAEAALQAGNEPAFERIHNELRATLAAASVGPISTDAMSPEQQVDFHFRERALWLWLTGHRLGDMRRLGKHYGRAVDEVFPTGAYFRPQFPTYGTNTNFPVPINEANNPNFTGCVAEGA